MLILIGLVIVWAQGRRNQEKGLFGRHVPAVQYLDRGTPVRERPCPALGTGSHDRGSTGQPRGHEGGDQDPGVLWCCGCVDQGRLGRQLRLRPSGTVTQDEDPYHVVRQHRTG